MLDLMNIDGPIRVLFVYACLNRGGAETMAINLMRKINRNIIQFDFVKHHPEEGAYEKDIIELGGKIYLAPQFKGYNVLEYRNWWKKHLASHPEHVIIHDNYYSLEPIYADIAKKYGRIRIVHSHSTARSGKWYKMAAEKMLESQLEKTADYFFACGMEAGIFRFPNKHFEVLNNAIDAKSYSYNKDISEKVKKKLGIENCLVIGTVGRITDQKNPYGIIEIFKKISKLDDSAVLLWAGTGDMLTQVIQKIESEGLKDKIYMLGVRSDVPELMQAMDAFILPSKFEGLPVVGVEAQAAGLRCYFSNGITKETDITGRCEFIDIDDYDEWARRITSGSLDKVDTYEDVCRSGYDVCTTANWLMNYYTTIYKKVTEK